MRKYITLLGLLLGNLTLCHAQDDTTANEDLFYEIEQYLYSPNQERKQSKDYFKNVKSLAEVGNAKAYYYLGMLQKDGIGTKQNFKKSRKSFKQAYDLGDTNAAYCLGYFFLKGFGDIPQDYKKAYKWFKRSDLAMAKHWMAKMNFMGLGREANKKKALKILESNDLYNSEVLAEQYAVSEPPTNGASKLLAHFTDQSTIEDLYDLKGFQQSPSSALLEGHWTGEYLELDWAKTKVLRALPIALTLDKEEGVNEQMQSEIHITDSLSTAVGFYDSGNLSFGAFEVPIRKQYTDYPNFTHLMTNIEEIQFKQVQLEGKNVMIGKVKATHPVWQERTKPTLLLLQKDHSKNEEVQQAFEGQKDDFIRLYPNPFKRFMLINFELEQEANIHIEITNYYNTPAYQKTVFKGSKNMGNHIIEVFDGPTSPGSYLVTITKNGAPESKIIIKN